MVKEHSLEHSCCLEWKCLPSAQRAWSWLLCLGSCCCAVPPKVSALGHAALGCSSWATLHYASHTRVCVLASGWCRRALIQQSILPNPPSLLKGSWIAGGWVGARQHGNMIQIDFIKFFIPWFQHKATRTAVCLTPKPVCLGGPLRVILNSSPAKSAILMRSCRLLFRWSCFSDCQVLTLGCLLGQDQWFEC